MTELGLGCVALGLKYGNGEKRMSEHDALAILKAAYQGGIRHFDSAESYGLANERILASGLCTNLDCEVATKITADTAAAAAADTAINQCFDMVYFHDGAIADGLADELLDRGFMVGVSVYTMEEALTALEYKSLSAIQVPVSLLDRRFVEPSFVAKCKAKRVRLVARSILLQGVLSAGKLPEVTKKPLLKELRKILPKDALWRRASFCYIFGNCAEALDIGLVGVQSLRQLYQAVILYKEKKNDPLSPHDLSQFDEALAFATEHQLYDPRTWNG